MPKGFSLVTERATGRVLFSPLMEESTVSKFDALLRALAGSRAARAFASAILKALFHWRPHPHPHYQVGVRGNGARPASASLTVVLADAAPVVDNGPFTLFSPCRDKKKTNNFRKLFLLFYFFYLLLGEKYKRSIIYAPPQFRGSMKHRTRRNSFEMCVKLRFVNSFF